jgi:hypothetical protein
MVSLRDERVQVCLPGMWAAHHRRLQREWHSIRVPDLFPEIGGAASSGVWRCKAHPYCVKGIAPEDGICGRVTATQRSQITAIQTFAHSFVSPARNWRTGIIAVAQSINQGREPLGRAGDIAGLQAADSHCVSLSKPDPEQRDLDP